VVVGLGVWGSFPCCLGCKGLEVSIYIGKIVWLLPVLVFRPEGAGVILSENAEQKTLSGMYLFSLSVCLIVCSIFLERYLLLCICKKKSDHKGNYEFRLITAL